MGAVVSSGVTGFPEATDAFIDKLREQVSFERASLPIPLTLPPRGVRQWVNLMVATWRFTDRWRTHIVSSMPTSIQAVIAAVDVVITLIAAQNHPGPE